MNSTESEALSQRERVNKHVEEMKSERQFGADNYD